MRIQLPSELICLLSFLWFPVTILSGQPPAADDVTRSTTEEVASYAAGEEPYRRIGILKFKSAVTAAGIRLFVHDLDGNRLSANRGRGSVTMRVAGIEKRFRYDLLPDGKGGLIAPVNLAKVAGRQVELEIRLIQLPDTDDPVSFREVIRVPPSEAQLAASAIARQMTCPVSGKPLGSMGDPIPVTLDSGVLYVCCAGCARPLKANPSKYVKANLTVTVSKPTEADASLIRKQKRCPVMDEPLGSMGQPAKVTVGKRPIFLCCAGCIKKVQADPMKYVKLVYGEETQPPKSSRRAMDEGDSKGEEESSQLFHGGVEVRAGVFRVVPTDAPYIEAQSKCPVMDEPLDAMDGPYRVNAAGKAVYICCPACAKKVFADPNAFIDRLKKNGVVPPTIK